MSTLPLVSLSRALSSDSERRAEARAIDAANRTVGFLVLTDHGVAADLVDDLYRVTAEFFALPAEIKNRYVTANRAASRGYVPPKVRSLAATRERMDGGDLVELFAAGLPHVPDDPYFSPEHAGINFRPNVWPAEIPRFRAVWETYYDAMQALAAQLMSLFATALDLPADFFDDKIDRHISNLFANHYPPILEQPAPGQIRVGEHTDYGSLTLLHQRDEVGGLEVHVGGRWVPVEPMAGAYVVNIGDLMARWTNDRWISTLHRVQNPPPERLSMGRLSFPFFCQPNYDTVIEALPSCVGPAQPPRYPPISSGENMIRKTERSFSGGNTR
ncbi:isopenicillin N synthase family dioxygenase [Pseudonocardia zijingensis]|uniref:2-oxoglutarate and iron-dependent oxygenase domain-containing protein n=1 Tax=Pseudonocardia zijingensis TaxID=153376 RepID=A0ABN1N7W6_9PSEU